MILKGYNLLRSGMSNKVKLPIFFILRSVFIFNCVVLVGREYRVPLEALAEWLEGNG